jgi:hypothetical protein
MMVDLADCSWIDLFLYLQLNFENTSNKQNQRRLSRAV